MSFRNAKKPRNGQTVQRKAKARKSPLKRNARPNWRGRQRMLGYSLKKRQVLLLRSRSPPKPRRRSRRSLLALAPSLPEASRQQIKTRNSRRRSPRASVRLASTTPSISWKSSPQRWIKPVLARKPPVLRDIQRYVRVYFFVTLADHDHSLATIQGDFHRVRLFYFLNRSLKAAYEAYQERELPILRKDVSVPDYIPSSRA